MALKIRLSRGGKKSDPAYRIVVANSTSPRDGKCIECVGYYHPTIKDETKRYLVKSDRVSHWIGVGAKPTERVVKLMLKNEKCIEIAKKFPISVRNRKTKKATDNN